MKRKDKTIKFIGRANEVHLGKYDYSLVDYINVNTKITIICPEHGEFNQNPNKHIYRKQGCPNCSKTKKLTLKEFIGRANEVHLGKYDYSLVDYISMKNKITIICSEHGEFNQEAGSHITQKTGCSKCSKKYNYTNEDFKKRANLIHNNKYNYKDINYINNYTIIKIICPEHGEFEQIPSNHLSGKGCGRCSTSKNETLISRYLDNNNINYIGEYKFDDCKYKRKLPFDFYLPEHNTCIEFNGKQHYKPVDFFGGEEGFKLQQKRDIIKETYCNNNKIPLLIIKYNENVFDVLSIFFNNTPQN